ncbi:PhnA domain-containing protein [Mucilaginibacter aquaedulcis]|uniref:PhnA domain-containing protein n=1 Tax=Mucilaginibacter aquaedulcis TaxID=1187081 RepID=UPI0025B4EF1D|nr:PhnA domain-containing protein [Mucilaginibacter aquaedulcis]MDN3550594.1 PhnA domain-containing protein [Mucilaginibacter aquaedulcis]
MSRLFLCFEIGVTKPGYRIINRNILNNGDSVTLIKSLKVKVTAYPETGQETAFRLLFFGV